ncbi:MAG: MerR family transcriptional regulator [Acidobacteria bacterium]|nr:MAG: MerR family transcriptional regulator [Acidobacteriota bacterium]
MIRIEWEAEHLKTATDGLLRAQEFAERAGVTVRTLHHYDRLGLLKPTRHTASGYRLYGERDLARLQQIVALKFIGLPLKQIKHLLDQRDLDLRTTLRLQREVVEEKRRHLDSCLEAIKRAEHLMSRKGEPDWQAFRKIIEVINMQNDMEWMKKYYTEEQLADLARRGTPEVLKRGEREWAVLLQDVDDAIKEGVDPASERAQALVARWSKLIEEFTGGDPGILENLRKLYADQVNWPSNFNKPFSNEAASFICEAQAKRKG